MYSPTTRRLISLSEAFELVGRAYVPHWIGTERLVASPGRRSRDYDGWVRARSALTLLTEWVRDGRVGLVASDGKGGRLRYFEHSREDLTALLLSPDPAASGFAEFASGSMMECEIDISSIRIRRCPRATSGRKPAYQRFTDLVREGFEMWGATASHNDLKNHARKNVGKEPYPESSSTQNDIIRREREAFVQRRK